MPLSNTVIRHINPGDKTKKVCDGDGLYLEVAPSGGNMFFPVQKTPEAANR